MKKFFLISVLFSIFLSFNVFGSDPQLTTTDVDGNPKSDYSPGDIVYIHGSGFDASASITATITRPDSSIHFCYPTSDSAGNFVCEYDLNGVFGTYNVYATDGTNEATTTFTDSTIWTTDGYAQQKNSFDCGEVVGIDGAGLTPSVTLNYEIKDQPSGGNVVSSGTIYTNADGGVIYTNGGYAEVWIVPPDYTITGQHKIYVYDNPTKTKTFDVEEGTSQPYCGDGNLDPGEQCDDGNTIPGDGCDANCQWELDFGDAPDPTYPTLLASNGARHIISPNLYLGATVDPEPDGQPTANADGDDLDGNDDEDGVTFFGPFVLGYTYNFTVTASAEGKLDAWVDFNGNGVWESSEQIFTSQPLKAGVNVLWLQIPTNAVLRDTYARFRFSTAGSLSTTGLADDGEVEDYKLFIYECEVDSDCLPGYDCVHESPAGFCEPKVVIPEFTNIRILVVLAIAIIGIFFYIRKKN